MIDLFKDILFWFLGRKHEMEVEKKEEKEKQEQIEQEAHLFICDHEKELDYLPLCQVAQSLDIVKNNHREIVTQYIRCNPKVRAEILKQTNTPLIEISQDQLDLAVEKLDKELNEKFHNQPFLYDNGKYYKRALSRYSEEIVKSVNPYIFKENIPEVPTSRKKSRTVKRSLLWGMRDFLQIPEKERENILSPVDSMWEYLRKVECPENLTTYGVMCLMINGCYAMHPEIEVDFCGEELVETQEDMFYYTALVLYETYCNNGENEKQ